jgi:transposase
VRKYFVGLARNIALVDYASVATWAFDDQLGGSAQWRSDMLSRDHIGSSCEGPRNRAQTQGVALLKRQTKARLMQVERQIAELDAEITALIEAHGATARNRDILCSMPRIGAVTAAAMLTLLPRIGTLQRKQVASPTGLAPITRQSGQWQRKSFIAGRRKPLRDALYTPAMVAIRFDSDLRAKYDALRTVGKPAKPAIVVVMRKLIEMVNTLVKADRI